MRAPYPAPCVGPYVRSRAPHRVVKSGPRRLNVSGGGASGRTDNQRLITCSSARPRRRRRAGRDAAPWAWPPTRAPPHGLGAHARRCARRMRRQGRAARTPFGPRFCARSTTAPAMPAIAAAPAITVVPGVAAPVPTRALPAAVVPTEVVTKEEELRVLDREDLCRGKGAAHGGFGRTSQRQGEPRCDGKRESGQMKRFHSCLLVCVDRRKFFNVAARSSRTEHRRDLCIGRTRNQRRLGMYARKSATTGP